MKLLVLSEVVPGLSERITRLNRGTYWLVAEKYQDRVRGKPGLSDTHTGFMELAGRSMLGMKVYFEWS